MHVEPRHTADELAALIRAETRAKVARRLTAVRLALLGHRPEDIAPQAFVTARQVRTWVARYNADGPGGLADAPGRGRKPPLDAAQGTALAAPPGRADGRRRGLYPAGRGRPPHLEGRVRRRPVAAGRLRPAARPRVRAPPPPAAPPEGVGRGPGRLQKQLPAVAAGVAAARPGERVEVWFEDEARFGPKGALTTVWADKGTRPTAPKQGAFGNLHVLTAVCPATGRAEGLVGPALNAGVVQSFLDHLSATIPAGTHAVLVWDGAGYHSARKALRCPANMTLVTLPPYAPELNPVERLWLYLRQHHWSNRTDADLGALEEAAVAGWRAVCLTPERVQSVCRCEYAEKGSQ